MELQLESKSTAKIENDSKPNKAVDTPLVEETENDEDSDSNDAQKRTRKLVAAQVSLAVALISKQVDAASSKKNLSKDNVDDELEKDDDAVVAAEADTERQEKDHDDQDLRDLKL